MELNEAKQILENAGYLVEDTYTEDEFVRDTITKIVNDYKFKDRNKALIHNPKTKLAIEDFIRNYYNSMPSIDDCIYKLYDVIDNENLV